MRQRGEMIEAGSQSDTSVQRAPWSPAQIVSLVIGVAFVIVGGIALARTGFNFNNLSGNKQDVLGMPHTAILALAELVVGLALVAAGAVPGAARGTMILFGIILVGVGVVAIAQPSTFDNSLGANAGSGWFLVITGAVLLLAAMVSPTVFGSGYNTSARRLERTDVAPPR